MRLTKRFLLIVLIITGLAVAPFLITGAIENLDRPAQFLKWVNDVRVSHGRNRLLQDDEIELYAKAHSIRMAAANEIYHSTDRQLRLLCPAQYVGEIVGVSGSGGDPRSVFLAFMRSDGHRVIILGGHYRVAGFGVVQIGDHWWITGVFCSTGSPTNTKQIELAG